MSAPVKTSAPASAPPAVRHLSTPELAHAWSLCGIPRGQRPFVAEVGPGEELCVVCATEYERIRGFRFEERQR